MKILRLLSIEARYRRVGVALWWHSWRVDSARAAVTRHEKGLEAVAARCDATVRELEEIGGS